MSRQPELMKTEPQSVAPADRWLTVAPACDVYENDNEVLVVADVPGVTADALDVNLAQGELSFKARRFASVAGGTSVVAEYGDRDFHRRFAVPDGIDAGKISAELKNGVLWLHLPKAEALKPRQIAVQAG